MGKNKGGVPKVELKALQEFYKVTGGEHWRDRTGWDGEGNMPVADWEGVRVIQGKVCEIQVPGNDLSGYIPECLCELLHLHLLDLGDNSLSGPVPLGLLRMKIRGCAMVLRNNGKLLLPDNIGKLGDVGQLDLHDCSFGGEFPDALFDMCFKCYFFNFLDNDFDIKDPLR